MNDLMPFKANTRYRFEQMKKKNDVEIETMNATMISFATGHKR